MIQDKINEKNIGISVMKSRILKIMEAVFAEYFKIKYF